MSDLRAKELSIRIEKNLLGRFGNKSCVKLFIDDLSAQLLDNLHQLCKHNTDYTKKESQKVVKYLIKIIIKTAIISKNKRFTQEELKYGHKFKEEFRCISMTVISFHELDFSYDRNYITNSLNTCKQSLKQLLSNHLTEKSLNKIDFIFKFFSNQSFLDTFFRQTNGELKQLRDEIVRDLSLLVEKRVI
ncbi:unnamed protein product [Oppiella nova]|uniref:Tumor necrosis factor alpha-induced protein 8-like protein n=1 Tax=Oppiella nova TaxID=334625 RepID=A0A7R9LZ20_9ACAR|nr:unnamed protein product [Oppiella nova]CAG2168383.1 unnamed protein product [Oppiella nova]